MKQPDPYGIPLKEYLENEVNSNDKYKGLTKENKEYLITSVLQVCGSKIDPSIVPTTSVYNNEDREKYNELFRFALSCLR